MSAIGTALTHARENRLPVEVLVEGHWLRGQVAMLDGFGVVLNGKESTQSVVRIECISAVTISEASQPAPVVPHMAVAG